MALLDIFKKKESETEKPERSSGKMSDEDFIESFLKASYTQQESLVQELIAGTGKMRLFFRLRKIAGGIRGKNPPFSTLYRFETLAMTAFSEGIVGKWAAGLAYNSYYDLRSAPYAAELRSLTEKGQIHPDYIIPLLSRMEQRDGLYMPLSFINGQIRALNTALADLLLPVEEGVVATKYHEKSDSVEDFKRLKKSFLNFLSAHGQKNGTYFINRIEHDKRLSEHAEALRLLLKEKDTSSEKKNNSRSSSTIEASDLTGNAVEIDSNEYAEILHSLNKAATTYRSTKNKRRIQKEILDRLRQITRSSTLDYTMEVIEKLLKDPDLDPIAALIVRKIQEKVIENNPRFYGRAGESEARPAMDTEEGVESGVRPAMDTEEGVESGVRPAIDTEGEVESGVRPAMDTEEGVESAVRPAMNTEDESDEKLIEYRQKLDDYENQILKKEKAIDERIEAVRAEPERQEKTKGILNLILDKDLNERQRTELLSELDKTNSLLSRIVRYVDQISRKLTRKELRGYLDKMIPDLQKQNDIVKNHPEVIRFLHQYRDSLIGQPGHLLQNVHIAMSKIKARFPGQRIRAALEQLALLDDYIHNPEYDSVKSTLLIIYRNIINQDLGADLIQKIENSRGGEQSGFLEAIKSVTPVNNPFRKKLKALESSYDYKRRKNTVENEMRGRQTDMRSVSRYLEKSFDGDPTQTIKSIIRDPEFRVSLKSSQSDEVIDVKGKSSAFAGKKDEAIDDLVEIKKSARRLMNYLKNPESAEAALVKDKIESDPHLPRGLCRIIAEDGTSEDLNLAISEIEQRGDSPDVTELFYKALHHVAKEKKILNRTYHNRIMEQVEANRRRAVTASSDEGSPAYVKSESSDLISGKTEDTLIGNTASEIPAAIDDLINQALLQMGDIPDIDTAENATEIDEIFPGRRDSKKDEKQKHEEENRPIVSGRKTPAKDFGKERGGKSSDAQSGAVKNKVIRVPEKEKGGGLLGGFLGSLIKDESSKSPATYKKTGVSQSKKSISGKPGFSKSKKESASKGKVSGTVDVKKLSASMEGALLESIPLKGNPKNIINAIPSQRDLEQLIKQRSEFKNISEGDAAEDVDRVRKALAVSVLIPQDLQSSAPGQVVCIPKKIWFNDLKRRDLVNAFRSMAQDFPPGSSKQRYFSYLADEMEMKYYDKKYKI